jgi:hypothetical protein
MATGHGKPKRWSSWTIEIKVWKILAALDILPILVLWFRSVQWRMDHTAALIGPFRESWEFDRPTRTAGSRLMPAWYAQHIEGRIHADAR